MRHSARIRRYWNAKLHGSMQHEICYKTLLSLPLFSWKIEVLYSHTRSLWDERLRGQIGYVMRSCKRTTVQLHWENSIDSIDYWSEWLKTELSRSQMEWKYPVTELVLFYTTRVKFLGFVLVVYSKDLPRSGAPGRGYSKPFEQFLRIGVWKWSAETRALREAIRHPFHEKGKSPRRSKVVSRDPTLVQLKKRVDTLLLDRAAETQRTCFIIAQDEKWISCDNPDHSLKRCDVDQDHDLIAKRWQERDAVFLLLLRKTRELVDPRRRWDCRLHSLLQLEEMEVRIPQVTYGSRWTTWNHIMWKSPDKSWRILGWGDHLIHLIPRTTLHAISVHFEAWKTSAVNGTSRTTRKWSSHYGLESRPGLETSGGDDSNNTQNNEEQSWEHAKSTTTIAGILKSLILS